MRLFHRLIPFLKGRLRFRLRSLFIFVTIIAICLVFGPKLWFRYRVNSAVTTVLKSGPDIHWQFGDPFDSPTVDQFMLLCSDVERVLDTLMGVVTDDAETTERQAHALETMQVILARTGTPSLRKRYLKELIDLVTSKPAGLFPLDTQLQTIAEWIPTSGIELEDRAKLFSIAKQGPLTPGWASVLITIGGRQELLYVLQHVDIHDSEISGTVFDSLFHHRWPGLFPYVENWIGDPAVVERERLLDYGIMTSTPRGRQLLLTYAADSNHPLPPQEESARKPPRNLNWQRCNSAGSQ